MWPRPLRRHGTRSANRYFLVGGPVDFGEGIALVGVTVTVIEGAGAAGVGACPLLRRIVTVAPDGIEAPAVGFVPATLLGG